MIYKIKPNRVRRTYLGGSRIDTFENYGPCACPEDWTASITVASNGDDKIENEGIGITEDGELLTDIIGEDSYPLLVKLLDSDERLVVQAHPTVEFSKKHLNCDYGKTECWYFLECNENAYVYAGFKPNVTREMWEKVFDSQDVTTMLSYLHKVPVKKGDFLFIPGGLPHAIGEGCFMIELQEPSDLMVVNEKYTPSGRKIADYRLDMGLGRKLMFDVYDYHGYSFEELTNAYMPTQTEISENVYEILGKSLTDKFSMVRLCQKGTHTFKRKYAVAIVTDGSGTLNSAKVKKGDRILLKNEPTVLFDGTKDFSVILCF